MVGRAKRPHNPAGGFGGRCKPPNGVRGGAPEDRAFKAKLSHKNTIICITRLSSGLGLCVSSIVTVYTNYSLYYANKNIDISITIELTKPYLYTAMELSLLG